ncbi:MAG: hypothetical protein MJZ75_05715, partial [Paludibacteraceae bacterium]|nr:hypothetical protein [Paludibacteraceae bacterium]
VRSGRCRMLSPPTRLTLSSMPSTAKASATSPNCSPYSAAVYTPYVIDYQYSVRTVNERSSNGQYTVSEWCAHRMGVPEEPVLWGEEEQPSDPICTANSLE